MTRILAVLGSPRVNGNTHTLLKCAAEAAEARGAEIDWLLLGSTTVTECNGCHACWRGRDCPCNDDMNGIYDRIAACDVLLLGTPVYWYGPTALLKAFIDRFVYFNCAENRPKIAGKTVATAIVFEETTPETAALTAEFFRQCCKWLETPLLRQIIVGDVGPKGAILEKPAALEDARALGVALAGLPPHELGDGE